MTWKETDVVALPTAMEYKMDTSDAHGHSTFLFCSHLHLLPIQHNFATIQLRVWNLDGSWKSGLIFDYVELRKISSSPDFNFDMPSKNAMTLNCVPWPVTNTKNEDQSNPSPPPSLSATITSCSCM